MALVVATGAEAAPGERTVGSTYWVGTQHFQYLGRDPAGRELWLYPHLDGVFEIFTATTGRWSGSLDSSYDPLNGLFDRRFSATEVLNQLLAKRVATPRRKRAAQLLTLFAKLHPTEKGPFYLEPARRGLRKHLDAEGAAWVTAAHQRHDRLLARVDRPGTEILPQPTALRSSDDHYRALVGDGFLDIAIVGGNSEDRETGEFHSRAMADDLLAELKLQKFKGSSQGNVTHCEKTVRLFGHDVRIRLRLATAGRSGAPTRHSVATFVEGLARADVVVYFGHSNEGSGYYLSESRNKFSRFRLGFEEKHGDLSAKCYGLGKKGHQILALNSCLSYVRYCAPIRSFYDNDATATAPGFVGTNDRAPMDDFAPRVAKLIELLQKGSGPRQLAEEVNAIRPTPKSPDMLFRGVLQPRHSFIVPKGVTLKAIEERDADEGYAVKGTGSDGETYDSTGVFPQNDVGEIVQVIPQPKGVYGVSRDGRLLSVSRKSEGASIVIVAPSEPSRRIVFAAWAKRQSKTRLYLLDTDGRIRYLSRKADRLISPRHDPLPDGFHAVAIGNSHDGRFVAVNAAGKAYAYVSRGWESLEGRVDVVATPSLLRAAEISFGE
jgi:hypothetical protein